jgi:hypothetical protein
MGNRKSIASILLFAGSLLCFFLPFVTVSCGGQKIFTLSGLQMATGTEVQEPQPFGTPKSQKIDPHPFATVAALCALAGVALSLTGTRLAAAAAVSGAAGAVSLGVMASQMETEIQNATKGLGQVNVEVGFSLATTLLVAATAWNIYLFVKGKKAASSSGIPAEVPDTAVGQAQPAVSPGDAEDAGFCGECGAKLKKASPYCSSCGAHV